jgi:hypothetical protein
LPETTLTVLLDFSGSLLKEKKAQFFNESTFMIKYQKSYTLFALARLHSILTIRKDKIYGLA